MKFDLRFLGGWLMVLFVVMGAVIWGSGRVDAVEVGREVEYEVREIADEIEVSIKADGDFAEGVLGVAFHFLYDTERLVYLDYRPGKVFEKGGDEPIYMVRNGDGRLMVGVSLRRGDVLPVRGGEVVVLRFVKKAGVGDEELVFGFENGVVSGLGEWGRVDFEGVKWTEGVQEGLGLNGSERRLDANFDFDDGVLNLGIVVFGLAMGLLLFVVMVLEKRMGGAEMKGA